MVDGTEHRQSRRRMRILTVVGARPQFVKSAPVGKAISAAGHTEILVHTGQHYDYEMSQVFFEEMGIPEPHVNLGIGSGTHAWQTGQMLIGLEEVLQAEDPDWVLVYGDTNSTLAGALAACKLRLPLAHVEAGPRGFNWELPEECNRVLTDHCADLLFCATETDVDNLAREGITRGVHQVGDTMYDAMLQFGPIARQKSKVLDRLGLKSGGYLLATVHRAHNSDDPKTLSALVSAFAALGEPLVFPVHPRTRKRISELESFASGDRPADTLRLIEPVGYLDMLVLEQNARLILTDSGGVQREAYFLGVPCVPVLTETLWPETEKAGWNVVVGTDIDAIKHAVHDHTWPVTPPEPIFGTGHAAEEIVRLLE